MSLSNHAFAPVALLLAGGTLFILAAGWNLARRPRPAGIVWLARGLFTLLLLATGVGAVWTGLATWSHRAVDLPAAFPALPDAPGHGTRETIADLSFYRDPEEAWREARRTGRPLLIDFFADWCDPCHRWQEEIARPGTLRGALGRAVLVQVRDTDPAFAAFQEHPAHEGLRVGLPYFLILSANGRIVWQSNDYRDGAGMTKALETAGP